MRVVLVEVFFCGGCLDINDVMVCVVVNIFMFIGVWYILINLYLFGKGCFKGNKK